MRAPRLLPRTHVVFTALALTLFGTGIAPVRANPVVESIPVEVAETLEVALQHAAPGLDPRVLALALQAHDSAQKRGLLSEPTTLTVIDYSRASVEPRFWVFDLAARTLVFEELVAHGKNSGEKFATQFSNVESSLQTSIGLFVTRDVYFGKHGESLRLEGLEPGINDHALERAIVIHGAQYVGPNAIASLGFLGRSWGCPALSREAATRVIDRIKGGSAIFSFYPDEQWIASSQFLPAGSQEMLTAPMITNPVPVPASMAVLIQDEAPRTPVTFFPLRIAPMS